jgi:PhnB protein
MPAKVKPIPSGYSAVTPYLTVKDTGEAIEFYKQVFGATELLRLTDPTGKIAHAEIKIGDSVVMLAEETADAAYRSPGTLGGTAVRICVYVEDVDAVSERAVAAGAKLLIPIANQFYGDRSGRLQDPFGHIWLISTHVEDVSPEEMQRRFSAMLGGE